MTETKFENYCVVELMGHVTLAGLVTEVTLGGGALLRIDVPEVNGVAAFTQFFGASAIYRMTVVEESVARSVVETPGVRVRPVSAYLLSVSPVTSPAPPAFRNAEHGGEFYASDDDDFADDDDEDDDPGISDDDEGEIATSSITLEAIDAGRGGDKVPGDT